MLKHQPDSRPFRHLDSTHYLTDEQSDARKREARIVTLVFHRLTAIYLSETENIHLCGVTRAASIVSTGDIHSVCLDLIAASCVVKSTCVTVWICEMEHLLPVSLCGPEKDLISVLRNVFLMIIAYSLVVKQSMRFLEALLMAVMIGSL